MLYIRLKNGQPFEHPITQENLLLAFPGIDLQNLPEYISVFQKTNKPNNIGVYEIIENYYAISADRTVTEFWSTRPMTELEKQQKQIAVKTAWQLRNPYSLWIFNEETCQFDPPVSYPNDGKTYEWNDNENNWIEIIPD